MSNFDLAALRTRLSALKHLATGINDTEKSLAERVSAMETRMQQAVLDLESAATGFRGHQAIDHHAIDRIES